MRKGKIHLRGYSLYGTLCGVKLNILSSSTFAKTFESVTCKRCMSSWQYRQYLAGKFEEKPVKKSQTQGYLDIISKNN
jgi:hypothetical protein